MPVVNYPAPFPFLDASVVSAADLRSVIYNPSDLDGSLAILNGALDWDNIAGTNDVKREHTQRGSHVEAWTTSGTANLDYMYRWFSDYTTPSSSFVGTAAATQSARAVPGGSRTFFVRAGSSGQALIRMSWVANWTNDNGWGSTADLAEGTHIFLKLVPRNDTTVDMAGSQVREVNATCSGASGSEIHEGRRKNRTWSGHHLEWISASGWYTAALYIIQDLSIRQSRVWCRNMNVRRMAV
jgi:hypothetical protein